jgi:phosphate transport system substrate-binding protein
MTPRSLSRRALVALLTLSLLTLALAGCGARGPNAASETRIQGAGATFPNPIYQKWFSEYNKANPGVKFDYQSIGSGGGIKQISEKTVDFGGSDAPMKDDDLAKTQGQILHIPTVLGAVVLTYNIPGLSGELKF